MNSPMIIIGNGCAGAECVIALREYGYDGVIQMFADNALPPANPMLTTYYASGRIEWKTLFPYGMDFYERYHVEFHGEEPVTELLNTEHKVCTEKGSYNYSKCLIATGASALRPPIPGCDHPRVLVVRTPEDAKLLMKAGEAKPEQVLVVGASMVGIKVVEMFHNLKAKVTLADLAPGIFPLAASELCAERIEDDLQKRGIDLLFSAQLSAVEEREDKKLEAVFADGTRKICDYLMMCVGVRANLGFIKNQTLAMGRGILVDEEMRSSDTDVFAAGDVAQSMNLTSGQPMIIGLLANAREQGRTAGMGMLGKNVAFPGSFPHNITHYFNVDFVGIGDTRHFDKEKRFEKDGQLCQFFYTNGRLTGMSTLGKMLQTGVMKNRMMQRVLGAEKAETVNGYKEILTKQEILMQECALREAGWDEVDV